MPIRIKIKAYAKINLGLRVLRQREDGYHEILSLMQTIGLADELELILEEERGEKPVMVEIEPPLLEAEGEANLVHRAAVMFLDMAEPALRPPVRIRLRKRIPVGAGLGGGSSDAAATLAGLDRLLKLELPQDRLAGLAAELGSDIPFFLEGGTCLVRGRGEWVERLPPLPRYHLVLLLPPFSLPTAEVYRKFDDLDVDSGREDEETLWARPLQPPAGHLRNDLEEAALALRPELKEYRLFLERTGPAFFGMSGSGPAWFAGFTERERERASILAEKAASSLPGQVILTETNDQGYEIELD